MDAGTERAGEWIMADKNKGGRPLLFESADELNKKIKAYFDKCKREKDVPTISDLAVYLDTSRQTLINYEGRDEFFDAIKKAKDICLAHQEKMALKGQINPTVWIFSAKNNFDYRDKQEIESHNTNENNNHNCDDDIKRFMANATAEEKARAAAGDMTVREQMEIINRTK